LSRFHFFHSHFLLSRSHFQVEFHGDRFLHGWVSHQFKGAQPLSQLNIVARARQFSSFILLVGTVEGVDRYAK
jgi:hypothetical protein